MTGLTILGIVLFVGFIAACVFLFLATSNIVVEEKKPEVAPSNPDEVLRRCQELYDKDMHTELQRYAQRELAKNYGNVELRRILAKSLLEKGDEQLAIMHYEAILSITPNDTEIQEMLAQYYYENGPKNRSIELYEQILMNDIGNVNAVEMLCKLYEEVQMFDKAIEMCELMMSAEVEDEKYSELQYKIADLYIKIDNISSAFDAYEKIYKLDTQNLEIMIILADLAYQNRYLKYNEDEIWKTEELSPSAHRISVSAK